MHRRRSTVHDGECRRRPDDRCIRPAAPAVPQTLAMPAEPPEKRGTWPTSTIRAWTSGCNGSRARSRMILPRRCRERGEYESHDLAEARRATHAARVALPRDDRVRVQAERAIAGLGGRPLAIRRGYRPAIRAQRRSRIGRSHQPGEIDRCRADVPRAIARSIQIVVSRSRGLQRRARHRGECAATGDRDRSGSDHDFYRIASHLPAETRDYVPKLIAAARVGKQPAAYGLAG